MDGSNFPIARQALPEAQRDRFILHVKIDYPDRQQEREIVQRTTSTFASNLTPVLGKNLTFIPAQDSLQALINAYAETARSAATVAAARQVLGRDLQGTATTFTQAGDDSITLSSTANSPLIAQQDTAALLQVFRASMQGNTFFTVSVIFPPSLPTQSIQPRPPLIIGSAAILGLVLGFMCALSVDYVRREPALAG